MFEKIRKLDKLLGEQKNRQGLHKIRSERKDSITELIPQKYKGSKDTNTNNYMQANWKHLRNGKTPKNIQPPRTQSERTKKSEWQNY